MFKMQLAAETAATTSAKLLKVHAVRAPKTEETACAKKETPASASGVTAMIRFVAPGLSITASLKKMGKNLTCHNITGRVSRAQPV